MSTTFSDDLIGQRQRRIATVQELRDLGIDPYSSKATKDYPNNQVVTEFSQFEGKTLSLSGRLMSFRDHGKLIFGDLQDQSGRIQLCIRRDVLIGDLEHGYLDWAHRKLADVGDIVEAFGTVGKTEAGEVTLFVEKFKILTKSIRPIPLRLADKEQQFRKRYLDLIINPEKKWRFEKTAQITFAIREFLNSRGFLEIKTPLIQPLYGGGMAKPFKTHVNALSEDFFLAISHELYLKRLITAGFENVYNMVGYFRNEGIDRTHNPEFTMLETMTAYKDYTYNMDLIEEMYKYITLKVFNRTIFTVKGQEVDFGKPWVRMTMMEAVKKYAGYDFDTVKTLDEAHAILKEIGLDEKPDSIGECMVKVFEEKGEEHLVQPTFLTGHPVEISPLAKRLENDSRFAQRFEIFIGGVEGGDNWTELNDPVELFYRFKDQADKRSRGADETHPMDLDFIEMMEYGMPPTTGLGPGIERLAMMLTETEYMDDVVFFPMLRPAAITKQQKQIYGVSGPSLYPTLEKPELFSIDEAVKKQFPSLKVGVAIIRGVSVTKSNELLEKEKAECVQKLDALTTEDINTYPSILSYRKLYKEMGIDWHSKRPSPEALLRRIAQKKGLYTINTAVDAANVAVIESHLSAGVFDLDNMTLPTYLRFGKEGDMIHLLGDEKETAYTTKELGYFDEQGGFNIDFNYRDAVRSAVTEKTTSILINVDGIYDVTRDDVEEMLKSLIEKITTYCGGTVEYAGVAVAE